MINKTAYNQNLKIDTNIKVISDFKF